MLAFSSLFHAVVLMLLAIIVFRFEARREKILAAVAGRISQVENRGDDLSFIALPLEKGGSDGGLPDPLADVALTRVVAAATTSASFDVRPPRPDLFVAPSANRAADQLLKTQLSGRGETTRGALVALHGGNPASESAVAHGLRWLALHQNSDGSWSFDHQTSECRDSCTNPGSLSDCRNGATAMALLAFLGAGHTHLKGEYRQRVQDGLGFLLQQVKRSAEGADLRGDPTEVAAMYVQGMAGIVLCEAYAMSGDAALRDPAQQVVNFIVWAQDPSGGGWRYLPQQQGDTSVAGWQVMALTSARIAGLHVPDDTLTAVSRFLDNMKAVRGTGYGYTDRNRKASTTAVGLLCRMYLEPDHSRDWHNLGAHYLNQVGPSRYDMYYNYYATQFLHHYGGPLWTRWNVAMRDWLIATQDKTDHAAGSWAPRDRHGETGGRLYMTCMAVMTLEVYYRHLPLYQSTYREADH